MASSVGQVYSQPASVQGGPNVPNNVMYVTVPPNTALTTVTATRSVNIKAHRSIAILEFISMAIILLMEIINLVIYSDSVKMGTGVWFCCIYWNNRFAWLPWSS